MNAGPIRSVLEAQPSHSAAAHARSLILSHGTKKAIVVLNQDEYGLRVPAVDGIWAFERHGDG